MPESLASGLGIVLLAGAFQGSFMLPTKWMGSWQWENYWLIFAASAYLICPWTLAAATIPRLGEVYSGASTQSLALVAVFGAGWGIGAVTFGIGVHALGLALGFAIILGVAATSGTLIPLMVLPPAGFSASQGLVTAASLGVMLAGVAICSFAGRWKEQQGAVQLTAGHSPRSYWRGVAICVASGLFSACGNLGFAFGGEIAERAASLGASDSLASNALWTLLTLPLFVCNAGYAGYLLWRNRSARLYRNAGSPCFLSLAIVMGILWMAGFGLYGVGARMVGHLGPSLGWGILMASMVLVANLLGLLSGEWSQAPSEATHRLSLGIAALLLAIAGLAYANHLQA